MDLKPIDESDFLLLLLLSRATPIPTAAGVTAIIRTEPGLNLQESQDYTSVGHLEGTKFKM